MCVKNNKKNRADMKDSFSKRVPFETPVFLLKFTILTT